MRKFAEEIMFFPCWVDHERKYSVPETVQHVVVRVDCRKSNDWKNPHLNKIQTDAVHARDVFSPNNPISETLSEATKILKGDLVTKAIASMNMQHAVIYCRTVRDCQNMDAYLRQSQSNVALSYVCIHEQLSPLERAANLKKFNDNNANFLICTDIATDRIVIAVPAIIQVNLPDQTLKYVNRLKKLDRNGLSISLSSEIDEKVWCHSCQLPDNDCNHIEIREKGGCCTWYNESGLLRQIERELSCALPVMGDDFRVEINRYNGKDVPRNSLSAEIVKQTIGFILSIGLAKDHSFKELLHSVRLFLGDSGCIVSLGLGKFAHRILPFLNGGKDPDEMNFADDNSDQLFLLTFVASNLATPFEFHIAEPDFGNDEVEVMNFFNFNYISPDPDDRLKFNVPLGNYIKKHKKLIICSFFTDFDAVDSMFRILTSSKLVKKAFRGKVMLIGDLRIGKRINVLVESPFTEQIPSEVIQGTVEPGSSWKYIYYL